MNDLKVLSIKEMVKKIEEISVAHPKYEVFSDWVKMSALSISNSADMVHGELWKKREKEYMGLSEKYSRKQMKGFAELTGILFLALENDMEDVLGRVYMELEISSRHTGQFFTPFHISHMLAAVSVGDISGEEPLVLHEPSCGGGGMILAVAKVLKERGLDFRRCMRVTAQDIDLKAVYMCYMQLSIIGIKATVLYGNALSTEKTAREHIFQTPAERGMLV